LLVGWKLEFLSCSCRGDDQYAKDVHGAGLIGADTVPLATEHGLQQEGYVPAEARIGSQTDREFLKAIGRSDRKPFLLQKYPQIFDLRLKALRYLGKLRWQEHVAAPPSSTRITRSALGGRSALDIKNTGREFKLPPGSLLSIGRLTARNDWRLANFRELFSFLRHLGGAV
jgi:hypothetical protein